jgi:hypothetical protein
MQGGRQLTLFGLLNILVLIGCGGFIGAGIGELIGFLRGQVATDSVAGAGLAGGGGSFLLLIFWGWWFGRMDRIHPPCKCGKSDWKDFELGRAEAFRNTWQCSCGKKYSWPKWQLWFEISDNNTAQLYLTRNYFRNWRKATEQEISQYPPEMTHSRQQSNRQSDSPASSARR